MTDRLVRVIPTWEEYNEKVRRGTEAYHLGLQATAYAWGRQDERGEQGLDSRDTGDAIDFGRAYGVYAADHRAGRYGSRHPLQDAWRAWCTTGDIASLHAGDLYRPQGTEFQ